MSTFNESKIWINSSNNLFIIFDKDKIDHIIEKITIIGGILEKNKTIATNYGVIKSKYTIVVIKDQICALITLLGKGAYGKVYKAYDIKHKRMVAVKSQPIYYSKVIDKQASTTRYNGIGLADISSNYGPSYLSDKNGYFILPLADTTYYIWVTQKSIQGKNDLIVKSLIKIGNDIKLLHSNGLVHMDLKSDNVLVLNDIAYISDFGKSEKEGEITSSIAGPYKNYPHCDPYYFSEYSKNTQYKVSHKFDLYSYGFLIKSVCKYIRNIKYKTELNKIADTIHRLDPDTRSTLNTVIESLKLLK